MPCTRRADRGSGSISLSWAWHADAPSGHDFVGSYGRVFDIIVLARPQEEWQSPSMVTLESALFESGRPVLIAPPTPPRSLATNILIAWNRSTEQARTMAFAMPLSGSPSAITILTVEGVDGSRTERRRAGALARRKRHRRRADHRYRPARPAPAKRILAKAAELGCDLIVKGAYTQSRLRQMIFGGTTRHILANANLPVLMAH